MFDTDVDQTTYLSCGTIAAATLVELVALVPGQRWAHWDVVAYALWWAVVGLAMLGGSAVYWILIRDEEVELNNLSPTLLYPVTGVLATSAAGSVVVSYTGLSPRLGVGVLIVSYLLLGLGEYRRAHRATIPIPKLIKPSDSLPLTLFAGFFLAVLTLTAYFTRLLTNQKPDPKKVGAQFIPVGALANAAYAIGELGYVAGPKKRLLEGFGKGSASGVGIGEYIIRITIRVRDGHVLDRSASSKDGADPVFSNGGR